MDDRQNNKRELIIDAAIEVLANHNYENMKTAAVASSAGVAEGTIYRYFTGKRELFVEVLREISRRLETYFLKDVTEVNDLKTNLMLLAERFFQRGEEVNTIYRILYKAFSEVEDEEIRAELAETFRIGLDVVKRIISWEVDKRRMTYRQSQIEIAFMLVWGMGDIMWKRELVTREIAVDRRELEKMLDLFMKLLDV